MSDLRNFKKLVRNIRREHDTRERLKAWIEKNRDGAAATEYDLSSSALLDFITKEAKGDD